MSDSEVNGSPWRPLVLVVEDDDAIRRSLQLLLRSRGFDVRAYAAPAFALADRENRTAMCLISDLVLPGLDGIMLLTDLRAEGWQGAAILISGYLDAGRMDQAASAGFDAVLEKPVRDSRLVSTLTDLIDRNRPTISAAV
jgi:FixJ family two-component response regulator